MKKESTPNDTFFPNKDDKWPLHKKKILKQTFDAKSCFGRCGDLVDNLNKEVSNNSKGMFTNTYQHGKAG